MKGFRWKTPEQRNYAITKKAGDLTDHIKYVDDSILKEVIQCESNSDALKGRSPDPKASGCTQAFNIQPGELEFYRRMNLPLPRLCPNCRHYELIKLRTPYKLWHRRCDCNTETRNKKHETSGYKNTTRHSHGNAPCPNEFETSYPPATQANLLALRAGAPECPEMVYCEECYVNEVT